MPQHVCQLLGSELSETALSARFDGVPPSMNHAYATVYPKGRPPLRVLAAAGKAFKNSVILQLRHMASKVPAAKWYTLEIEVRTRIVSKTGEPLRLDTSNRVKLAEDAISEALGLDDRHFRTVTTTKTHSEREAWCFTLTVQTPVNDLFQGV